MDEGTRDARIERMADTQPYEEEFLFHLSRGSEYLIGNRVEQAKEELERALGYQPDDSKGQDLLASVYFRLGVYPRAIELWSRLVRAYPDEPALRVNLGLVLLKTGQSGEARTHFAHATEVDKSHARAWRYLGLSEWRCGRLDHAREAFLRGGEATMAKRMDEMLGERAELPSEAPPPAEAASGQSNEVRSMASDALERMSGSEPPLAVEATREGSGASGPWQVVEQGRDAIPRTARAQHPSSVGTVRDLTRWIDLWTAVAPDGASLFVAPNGLLIADSVGAVATRLAGLRASRGALRIEPIARRDRVGHDEGPLGADGGDTDEPIVRCSGPVRAQIAPPPGQQFIAVQLTDDVLFVGERYLQAFGEQLVHESARIGPKSALVRVVSLRGTGVVVLRLARAPNALDVASGDDVRVDGAALIGWTGRLLPIDVDGPLVALRGEGTVLIS
jgi:hypothetical protein